MQNEAISDSPAKTLVLLNQILALPMTDRLALRRAWDAMEPPSASGQVGNELGDAELSVQDEVERLNVWLSDIQNLSPKERVLLLQKAAADPENEGELQTRLQAELSKLKNENPWLAAEIAVINYAFEHPVLLTVALAGLGIGLYRFGKSMLAVIF